MSKGAKKQKVSAQEQALARNAAFKDARYESAFRPVEQAAIDELSRADKGKRTAMIAGRSNADLNQQSGKGVVQDGSGGAMRRSFSDVGAIATAGAIVNSDAAKAAQGSIDSDTLNVVKTGQDVSRNGDNSLVAAARLENSRAQNIIGNANQVKQARNTALGQIAGSAISGHIASKSLAGTAPAGPPQRDGTPASGGYRDSAGNPVKRNFYQRTMFGK